MTRVAAVLLGGLVMTTALHAHAGPITFNTALPVHSGEVIVREQLIWMRARDDPSTGNRVDVLAVPSVLVYGAHTRITLFGILPFFYKRMEVDAGPLGRIARSTSGFGDMTALVRVTALAINLPGETLRLAPFLGLKMPTGADDEADALGNLPQPFQLGTGSWDPIAGAIFTWQRLRWEVDVSVSYQLRTEANDFDAGDELRGEASFQYRIVPWGALGGGVPSYLFAVLESNAVWRDRDTMAGTTNPDSGGFTWYVAPGLQWITERTVLEAAVQVPVLRAGIGQGLRHDFVARLSFRVNF